MLLHLRLQLTQCLQNTPSYSTRPTEYNTTVKLEARLTVGRFDIYTIFLIPKHYDTVKIGYLSRGYQNFINESKQNYP